MVVTPLVVKSIMGVGFTASQALLRLNKYGSISRLGNKLNTNNFKFIDLFAGIGGIRIPFDELGGQCVFSSEWDEKCQDMYEANFGDRPVGDITKVNIKNIPDHDLLCAGFPCQAFSIIGKMRGFTDTRGTLFFNIAEILNEKKPYAFLLENVKQLSTHNKGQTFQVIKSTLRELGYYTSWKVLNALDFGLPQKRERTIIVGFRENLNFKFPEPLGFVPRLEDFLDIEADDDESLNASDYIINRRIEKLKIAPFYPSMWHENKSGNISVLPYSVALRSGASHSYLLVNGKRRLSSRELLRFQGFPESFKLVVNHSTIRKQAGNSVPIPMIRYVAMEMMLAIQNKHIKKAGEKTPQREFSL